VPSDTVTAIVDVATLLQAALAARRVRISERTEDESHRAFRHDDWKALVTRFAPTGRVDYANFRRVRRLLEEYLGRLSHARPEEWAETREQLAFYLNAYNAIAIYQVLLAYPVGSIRDIPGAFSRPYPVGRELHTLHTLQHTKIRAFGDPRVHAAVVPAARSAPLLRAYTGADLDRSLDAQMREMLADAMYGLQIDRVQHSLALNSTFRWFAGDFAAPRSMPSVKMLARGLANPASMLNGLRPYLPAGTADLIEDPQMRIEWLPFNWEINSSSR
jgi:hypothetical protein